MTDRPNSPATKDIAYLMHPYTNPTAHEASGPQIIQRGDGIYVYDDDGKKYIEGLAGLWYASLGFSEERLVKAATEQMMELPVYHTFSHRSTGPAIELAERIIQNAPAPMSKIFFTCSGSEAVDTAIKVVWYYYNAIGKPEKKKIISRRNGYHGVTVASSSLTGLVAVQKGFDVPIPNLMQTDCPHYYRYGEVGESEGDFATRMIENLEKQILEEGPETVAAFIAEPVMGAGGVIPPPATYFDKVQPLLKKYDILFIADEVICGFGRTGNMWGSQTYNLQPDMVTMAKAISAGYLPMAAVMFNDKIYQGLKQQSSEIGLFGHGFTYTGHPACAAVALETQKIYEERDTFQYAASVAPYFQKKLRAFADHPLVGEARGVGLIGAIEFVADKVTKEPFDPSIKVAAFANAAAYSHGLILRALPAGDSVAFCPPLIITEKQIDDMMDCFAKALDDTEKMLSQQGIKMAS
jgi:4-aminobutyrate--pyruvate transaminase